MTAEPGPRSDPPSARLRVGRDRIRLPAPRRLAGDPAFWYTATLALAWPVETLLNPDRLDRLVQWTSTNLANLHPSGHPLSALLISAVVPDAASTLWPLLAFSTFTVVAALGRLRAVAVLAAVHVGVTLLTESLVWWRIRHGSLPAAEEHTIDTGPSYLVVTAMAIAIGRSRHRWQQVVWVLVLAALAPSLLSGIGDGDYTAIGHVLAALCGVAVGCLGRRRGDAEPATGPAIANPRPEIAGAISGPRD